MPTFSTRSLTFLATCHLDLVRLAEAVCATYDCAVTEGYRDADAQHAAFADGRSKLPPGKSKHNVKPSRAIHLLPTTIRWQGVLTSEAKMRRQQLPDARDLKEVMELYYFAGFVMKTAESLGIALRWGGDWDRDRELSDQTFDDLCHFELADDVVGVV